jgi:Bacterial regulatory helix-turn-helix protein, lysR family
VSSLRPLSRLRCGSARESARCDRTDQGMYVEVIHLRYVVAAAEHRSFRRAAAALNIAQPTLSKRIRELEDRLGVLLFERSTGGTHLTANGQDFIVGAKRVLTDLASMESRAKAGRAGDIGRLEIGFYTLSEIGNLARARACARHGVLVVGEEMNPLTRA